MNVMRLRHPQRFFNGFEIILIAGILALVATTWSLSRFESRTVKYRENLPMFMLSQDLVVSPGVIAGGKSAVKVSGFLSISKENTANTPIVIDKSQIITQSEGTLVAEKSAVRNSVAVKKAPAHTQSSKLKTAKKLAPVPASPVLMPPTMMNQMMPSYPPEAVEKGWGGVALLRILIGIKGEIVDIQVEGSSGHSLLDNSALSTARQWKFSPARLGAVPVESWFRIPVRFSIES